MQDGVLVIGQSGQVARHLATAAIPLGLSLQTLGRRDFDMRDLNAIDVHVRRLRPRLVINTALALGVDASELDPALAFLVNRDAPLRLASACAAVDAAFVHLSTDCVFDGAKPEPYVESDATAPLSVYGRSKAEGERAILDVGKNAAVLRTSWVFSALGDNFVNSMLRRAKTQAAIHVVADQIGNPTFAPDLASACISLGLWLLQSARRHNHIFHYAGSDSIDRATQAAMIFEGAAQHGLNRARVIPVSSADFPTSARRPFNARLDSEKISNTLGLHPRAWNETLQLCLEAVAASKG